MGAYCQYFINIIYIQVKINFIFELMRITTNTLTILSGPECLFQVLINTLAADSASFLVGNLPFEVANSYGIALKFPHRLAMPVGFATSENARFTSAVVHYNVEVLVVSFIRE